jgi:peptidoglycan hydrolase CwlO-like protein
MAYPEDNDLQWSIDALVAQISLLDEHVIELCSTNLSLLKVLDPIAKEIREMNKHIDEDDDDLRDRLLRADVFIIQPEDKKG